MPDIKDKWRLDRPPTHLERLAGIAAAILVILLLAPFAGVLTYRWAVEGAPVPLASLLVLYGIVTFVSVLLYRILRGIPRALSPMQVMVVSGLLALASLGLLIAVALFPSQDARTLMALGVALTGLAASVRSLIRAKSALRSAL